MERTSYIEKKTPQRACIPELSGHPGKKDESHLTMIRICEMIRKIGRKELLYVCFMVGVVFLGFIKTVVFGAYLSPKFMGYYAIAVTIASYGVFLQLGLMSGLNRELPVRLGRGEESYASGLVGETTLAVIFLQLIGIIIFFAYIVKNNFHDSLVRKAFFLAGLLAFSNFFFQMILLRLKAEQRVVVFSLVQLLCASGILLFGCISIQYLSYTGPILTIVLINLISFLIVNKKVLAPVDYSSFEFKKILYLMRIGLPLMAAGVLMTLQMSMDRLFLIKNMSPEDIGIYQVGALPLALGVTISGMLNQYVGPRLLFRYGQTGSLRYVFSRSFLVSIFVIGVMLLFWPLVTPMASFVVNRWLPDYRASLALVPVFYFGSVFTAAHITGGLVINAANRQILWLYGAVFMVIMCYVGYLTIEHYALPIKWYAYVNVAIQITSFFLITGVGYYLAGKDDRAKN